MPQGVPTEIETLEQFRAHYLYSGNAAASARKVGLSPSTGRSIAQRLVDDPEFIAARRKLRASALDELVAMRMRVAQRSLTKFLASDPAPIESEHGVAFPPDRRPDFGKLVLEAEKNAQHLAKVEGGDGAEKPRPTAIEIIAREDDDDDGNDPGVE